MTNQVEELLDQSYNAASSALNSVRLAIEIIQGLDTFFNTIHLHSQSLPESEKIVRLAKLGLYYTHDQYANLVTEEGDLEKVILALMDNYKKGQEHDK